MVPGRTQSGLGKRDKVAGKVGGGREVTDVGGGSTLQGDLSAPVVVSRPLSILKEPSAFPGGH